MRWTARTARGPRRAPARLVTPRSMGTPTSATSSASKSLVAAAAGAYGRPRNVAAPAKGHLRSSALENTFEATAANRGSKISPPFAPPYFCRSASSFLLSMERSDRAFRWRETVIRTRSERLNALHALHAGSLEHRMEKHVGSGLEVLGLGVLDLVVADAVLAGHEDHRRRRDAREIHRVVRRAAHDLAARKPKHGRPTLHRIDAVGIA